MMRRNLASTAAIAALLHAGAPAGLIGAVRADGRRPQGDEVADLMGQVKAELVRIGSDVRQDFDKLKDRMESLETRNLDLEQQLASRRAGGGGGGGATRDAFAAALHSSDDARDALKNAEKVGRSKFTVAAAILTGPPSGPVPDADRRPEIYASMQRALRVRDLLTVTPTSAGNIEFLRETLFTNNAGVQTEGELKGESHFEFELVDLPVRTIAHWTSASKQVLSDVARLGSFLDRRLRYGLQLEEDGQLLLGSGVGLDLSGLVTEATAYSPPAGVDVSNQVDQIGAAIAQLRNTDHEPTGVVLHPIDWQMVLHLKDSEGRYLVPGGPFSTAMPMLYGKPTALTTAMTQGEFLVGQFDIGCELFEREETTVEISREDGDNFRKNMVTILAEERVVLAVYRPAAFVTGEFSVFTG